MATLLKTDGVKEDVGAAVSLTLEQMQAAVGGYIEVVHLEDGGELIINEEGAIYELPFNLLASAMWHGGSPILGNAIHFTPEEAKQVVEKDMQEE